MAGRIQREPLERPLPAKTVNWKEYLIPGGTAESKTLREAGVWGPGSPTKPSARRRGDSVTDWKMGPSALAALKPLNQREKNRKKLLHRLGQLVLIAHGKVGQCYTVGTSRADGGCAKDPQGTCWHFHSQQQWLVANYTTQSNAG